MTNHKNILCACASAALVLSLGCGDDGSSTTDDGSTGASTTTSATAGTSTTDASTGQSSSSTSSTTSGSTSDGTDGTSSGGSSGSTGGESAESGVAGGTFAPLGSYTGITGSALIVRRTDGTDVSVQLGGLTADTTYPAHVHAQACDDDMGGGHYKIDPSVDATEESNELWPAFTTDGNGNGRIEISTDHLARPDALSVVVHDPEADNAKMACADLVVPSPAGTFTISELDVTVLQAAIDDGYGAMTATASLSRSIDGSTSVELDVTGLGANATYPVHVHETHCSVAEGSGHYKIDYGIGTTEQDNELWLPVTTDGSGDGTSTFTVPDHIARAEAQSIVVHSDGGGNPRYACIDLG